MPRRRAWWQSLLNVSLASIGQSVRDRAYTALAPSVRRELIRELHAKGFEDIGPAEIVNTDGLLYDLNTRENQHTLSSLYEIHLYVQTCVSMVATSLPLAPLRFYRATGIVDGREELEPWDEHPVVPLFSYINPHMDPFSFWEWTLSFLQLVGEAYVAKVSPSPGAPEGTPFDLYPLFPAFVRKEINNRDGIIRYRYRVDGEDEIVLEANEVLYFKTFSPSDRWNGQGIMHAGKSSVLTDLRAQQFNDQLLKNGVFLHGTLETDDDSFDAEDAETVRDQFQKKYAGSQNAAKIAVLWGGMKFNPHQLAHNDIQFIDQRKMSREEIAIGHGIPLELLGLVSANYATLREKRRIFWQDTVQRWGRRLEHQMNSTILPMLTGENDLRCAWDYSQIDALQPDLFEIIKAGDIGIRSGQFTPDEWRQLQLQLPALGGASDLQFIGGGLKPIERVVVEAADAVAPGRNGNGNGGTDDEPAIMDEETERRIRLAARAPRLLRATRTSPIVTVTKARDRSFRELWATTQGRFEKRMEVMLRKVSREAQSEVGRVLASRSMLSEPELVQEITRIFILDGAKNAKAQAKEIMTLAARKWGDVTAADVAITDIFRLENTNAIKYIDGRARFFDKHYGTQGRKLIQTLRQGIKEGQSESVIKRNIGQFFRGDRSQLTAIARTETVGAMNYSANQALEQARKAGADVRAVWRTMGDGRVRGSNPKDQYDHLSAEGLEVVPGDELFVVSGESMQYPGDNSMGASLGNIISCRCTVQSRVVEKRV